MTNLLRLYKQYAIYAKFVLFCAFCCLNSSFGIAQSNVCRDSSQINYTAGCLNEYKPVCGCDGITYRNDCIALRQNGIVTFQPGICEPVSIEFNPNPVDNYMNLTVMRKEKGDVMILIYDLYGKLYYTNYYTQIQSVTDQIDTEKLIPGAYLILAYTTRYGTWRKFIKQPRP